MDFLLLAFLPGILVLGAATSWEDVKAGKISNVYILFSLVYAVLLYGLLWSLNYLSAGVTPGDYFFNLSAGALLSLALGYALWYHDLWSAGDAKLFFAYSVIVPPTSYGLGFVEVFPSLTILVNTFIPWFFVLYGLTLVSMDKATLLDAARTAASSRHMMGFACAYLVVWWGLAYLSATVFPSLARTFPDALVSLAAVLAALIAFRFFASHLMLALATLAGVVLIRYVAESWVPTTDHVASLAVVVALFYLFVWLPASLGQTAFRRRITLAELVPGMVLAEAIVWDGKRYITAPGVPEMTSSLDGSGIAGIPLVAATPGELDEETLATAKRLEREKRFAFTDIAIAQQIPFAPYLFAGVLISIILKTDVVTYVFS